MNDVLFPDYKNGDNFSIIGGMSTMQIFNIMTVLVVCEKFYGVDLISSSILVPLSIVLIVLNYFFLQWKGKDKRIYDYYKERETEEKRNLGLFFTWIYIVGTWGVFIWVANW